MFRVNNKGLVYNNCIWKDVVYYFKVMWWKDILVIRIVSCDWEMCIGEINKL